MKSLRRELDEMVRSIDILQYSQFTIDWVQENLECKDIDNPIDVDNGALAYNIDTLLEVLKEGNDKDLFKKMYAKYRPL